VALAQKVIGVTADGVFGPKTAAALKTWQAAHDAGFRALVEQPAWKDFPPCGALFEVASEYRS